MECQNDNCNSNRIASVTAKCDDRCGVEYSGHDHDGYVPSDIGIGGDDYITFSYCLECGQIQGDFPVEDPDFSSGDDEEEEEEEEDW